MNLDRDEPETKPSVPRLRDFFLSRRRETTNLNRDQPEQTLRGKPRTYSRLFARTTISCRNFGKATGTGPPPFTAIPGEDSPVTGE